MNDLDGFERDVSAMLEGRVANLPATYEIGPELVRRARRKRATKLTALAVGTVVVVVGTTGAIAQTAGRNTPQQVITSTPTSTPTPTRPSVRTIHCPASIPVGGGQPTIAVTTPNTEPRVPDAGDPELLSTLESFAAIDDPRYVVLGPDSWSCRANITSNQMVVYDPQVTPGIVPSSDAAPIAVYNDSLWHPDFGALLACSVFDDPAVIEFVGRNDAGNCLPDQAPGRIVTRVSAHVATFVDADGDRGMGWMVLPSSDTANDGKISVLECRVSTGQISAAACDTIIADYAARLDSTSPPSTTPSVPKVIADAPFVPGDWASTASGIVITDSRSDQLAAYDAAGDSWRTLAAPPFGGQPWIFATRGNDVFVHGQPADNASATTPFAMLDVATGKWQSLAAIPDRVFGNLETAGDDEHMFGYGAFDADIDSPRFPQHEVMVEYDVTADRWTKLPASPLGERSGSALQWTGRELLVWSGGDFHQGGGGGYTDGAAYDPATGTWRLLATAPVPARVGAASVWTGAEMLVWGGSDCLGCGRGGVGAGAAYNPATDSWTKLAVSPLRATETPAAVWTGSEMVVLGGSAAGIPAVAAYDPATDSWTSLPDPPTAAAAVLASADESFASWIGDRAIFGVLTATQKTVAFAAFGYTIGG